jgi:ParB family chromosome partitioning protein
MPAQKRGRETDQGEAAIKARPDVTQKGAAMIGDLRTDALHQALAEAPIEDDTLIALLVLAFGGSNVRVESGSGASGDDRRTIGRELMTDGLLTADPDRLRQAARKMLIAVLSCRANRSRSGIAARIAGEAIGAATRLPNMATEAFLTCLSRPALEATARSAGVNLAPKAKHTRARLIARFKDGAFVYPGALFKLTPDEVAADAAEPPERSGTDQSDSIAGDDGYGDEDTIALDAEEEAEQAEAA